MILASREQLLFWKLLFVLQWTIRKKLMELWVLSLKRIKAQLRRLTTNSLFYYQDAHWGPQLLVVICHLFGLPQWALVKPVQSGFLNPLPLWGRQHTVTMSSRLDKCAKRHVIYWALTMSPQLHAAVTTESDAHTHRGEDGLKGGRPCNNMTYMRLGNKKTRSSNFSLWHTR